MPFAVAFAFFAPSSALRVYGPVTVGDVALGLATLTALVETVIKMQASGSPRCVPAWVWVPGVAVATVGSVYVAALNLLTFLPLFVFTVTMVLVPMVLACHGFTAERLTRLMGAFVLGVAVNCAFAIVDSRTPGSLTARFTSGIEFGGDARPPGLTTHSNQLGLLCGVAVPIVAHLAQRAETRMARAVWIGSGVVILLGAAASGSRGGLLAVLAGAGLWTMLAGGDVARRAFLGLLGLVAAVAVAARLGLTNGFERLLGQTASTSASDQARLLRADVAWDQFTDHVWTGVGFTNGSAHNFYFEVARSGGIFILLLVIAGMLWSLGSAWNLRSAVALATPAFCASAVWIVFAAQHNATTARFIWIPSGFAAASWAIAQRQARSSAAPTRVPPDLATRRR